LVETYAFVYKLKQGVDGMRI